MARRFVTYNTEDQKAGRVNVDHNGVMKPGGGTGLPSDVGAYKYMATDGEGNWVPVDRLGYKAFSNGDYVCGNDGMQYALQEGMYVSQSIAELSKEIAIGNLYRVQFGEKYYVCEAKAAVTGNSKYYYIGNAGLIGDLAGTDEPFCFTNIMGIVLVATKEEKLFFIHEAVVETNPIPAEYLPNTRLVVNFTASGDTYTADATAVDVYETVKDGKTVTASLTSEATAGVPLNMFLIGCTAEGDQAIAVFGTFMIEAGSGKFTASQMMLSADGSASLITYSNGGYE